MMKATHHRSVDLLRPLRCVTKRLLTDRWWQVHLLFPWVANGMRQRLTDPLANSLELQIHHVGHQASLISLIRDNQPANPWNYRFLSEESTLNPSATTATLLCFALVLLDRSLVMTQTLEVGKDPSFRHLTLEATQR